MKISKSFFSILLLTPSVVIVGGKNSKLQNIELTTFYDEETDSKELVPWNLYDPYTSHLLKQIIRDTFDKETLPSHAIDIFETLLSFPPNFTRLPTFLDKQILKISQGYDLENKNNLKALILTPVNMACMKKNQRNYQKRLAEISK